MQRTITTLAAGVTLFFGLACSGINTSGGGGPLVPGGGGGESSDVSHSTWEANNGQYRLKFGGSDATYTWRNMTGPAVGGSWTQSGKQVHVTWEPASHMGNREFKMEHAGPCKLVLTWRLDKKGKGVDSSTVYERTVPSCDRDDRRR